MKLRSLLMGGAIAALLGIGVIGCNENPVVDEPVPGSPSAPTNLKVSSKSDTQVIVNWTPAVGDTGTITFTVSWSSTGSGGSGSLPSLTTTTATVSNLTVGQEYKFNVVAVRNGKSSAADTLTWMGADRYGETTELRMYEKASSLGSALAIDTRAPFSGPRNIKVATDPTLAQLAMVVSPDGDSVYVGPAFAFDEFASVGAFDPTVYIGKNAYLATGLDTWFTDNPINNLIVTADEGNLHAFGFMATPTGPDAALGQGFFVRTGAIGNEHFARVFVKNEGGKFLQGSGDDRFVEVTISYQAVANKPFAKSAGKQSPIGNTSQRRPY